MTRLRNAIPVAALLVLVGCAGSTPRAYQAFYQTWEEVPGELRDRLDRAREQADLYPERSEALVQYARLAARVTRLEADKWISTAASGTPDHRQRDRRHGRVRQRLLESCRHTLSLFNECRLEGARLPWTDRAEMAWVMVLAGFDDSAHEILEGLLHDPEVPEQARARLSKIQARLDSIPPEQAP